MALNPELDLDFTLPECTGPSLPPPQMTMDQYLEFIEFNMRLAVENGTIETMLAQRSRAVL